MKKTLSLPAMLSPADLVAHFALTEAETKQSFEGLVKHYEVEQDMRLL
jgi:hypothetical protein